MSQSLLFIALHLFGLALCLAFGPRGRPVLCCALAFPVGLAAAVFLALAIMLVGVPYGPWTLGPAMALAAIAAAIAAARRGTRRRDLIIAGLWTAGFAAICPALTFFNVAILTSSDSHRLLSLAIMIANDAGLERSTYVQLGSWGAFQVIAHSMMGLTQRDFLYSLPLVLGLTFIPVFALTLWHALEALEGPEAPARRRALLVLLVTATLFTTSMVGYHMVYLHTNFGSAIYLFVFVAMFWTAEVKGDVSWFPAAFLALSAFALHRTETPVVALLFLALTVTQSRLPRRSVTLALGGFTAAVVIWLLALAMHLPAGGHLLTPGRSVMMSALLVGFFLWWLASAASIVRRVNRRLPLLVALACGLALLAAFATRPGHMLESARNWMFNLTTLPLWGQTWPVIAVLALVGLAVLAPRFRWPFAVGLPAYFALVLFLVYFRVPYREGRGDSANRMTIQLLPLIVFYLAIKFIPALQKDEHDVPAQDVPRPPLRLTR